MLWHARVCVAMERVGGDFEIGTRSSHGHVDKCLDLLSPEADESLATRRLQSRDSNPRSPLARHTLLISSVSQGPEGNLDTCSEILSLFCVFKRLSYVFVSCVILCGRCSFGMQGSTPYSSFATGFRRTSPTATRSTRSRFSCSAGRGRSIPRATRWARRPHAENVLQTRVL